MNQTADIGDEHPGRRALEALNAVKFAASIGECSIDCAEWLERGLTDFIQGRQNDFGTALGFRPAERHELRLAMRNHHLLLALAEISEPLSPTARCKKLAAEINRFESRVWPRASAYTEPDPSWSKLRTHIWRARQYAEKLPTHWQSIERIQSCIRRGW